MRKKPQYFLSINSKSIGRKVRAAVINSDGTVSDRTGVIADVIHYPTIQIDLKGRGYLDCHKDDISFLD